MATSFVDLRDAARSLRRDPGFSLTVILTLAITLGATTAAFSIVDGILIRPLAYPEPDRLVTLREVWREVQHNAATLPVNQRHFEHWRRHNRAFQSMAQFITLPANLTSGGPAAQISAVQASGTLFDVLAPPPDGCSPPPTIDRVGRMSRSSATDCGSSGSAAGRTCWAPRSSSMARRSRSSGYCRRPSGCRRGSGSPPSMP
jgi:hypothetical protein